MVHSWLAQALLQFRAGPIAGGPAAAVVSIGNDAGDIDSLAASIAVADWQPVGGCSGGPLCIPVAPFARRDFRLRKDACLLFRHVGFNFDEFGAPVELLHLDEVEVEVANDWRQAGGLGMVLVDHNRCAADVASTLGERVVAIVDHHNDEQRHDPAAEVDGTAADALAAMLKGTTPLRVVEPSVGSTCSLLAERMDARPPTGSGGLSAHSAAVRTLLLSAIVVDCRGFEPTLLGKKFVATDVRAAQRLLAAYGVTVPHVLPPPSWPGAEAYELVLQSLLALRQVELPEEARVGGASTLVELSQRLLEARYDTRSLTIAELMRWDYKEATRATSSTEDAAAMGALGTAAICETAPGLLARSGGAAELEASMQEASACRGGLGLLFALTREDETDGHRKGLFALLPDAQEKPEAAAEAAAVLERLAGVPMLPEAMRSDPLFQAQSIESEGFGIVWRDVAGAPRLRRTRLREAVTRKTLMPMLTLGF